MNNGMVAIDGRKLRSQLNDKRLNAAELSRQIGYNSTYLRNCCTNNMIRLLVLKELEQFGITYDDVCPDVEEVEEEPEQMQMEFTGSDVTDSIESLIEQLRGIKVELQIHSELFQQLIRDGKEF